MRINKFVAQATGLSRRAADRSIEQGQVHVDGKPAESGYDVQPSDTVTVNGQVISLPAKHRTILLNKPVGYVVSRDGQGSKTVYDLLPSELHRLKPVGRLDKDSSGLLLLTDDGELANKLTHPKYQKEKIYHVALDRTLTPQDANRLRNGVMVEDYISRLDLKPLDQNAWQVTLAEGRNRQIRRTFEALGYQVAELHRTQFGKYKLDDLKPGSFQLV